MVPAREYFDVADVVVTFEGPFSEYRSRLAAQPRWLDEVDPARTAHLVYGATREQALGALARPAATGHLYVTSGTLPHPWGTVPDYLPRELAALERCP